jgi:hypothetical protein
MSELQFETEKDQEEEPRRDLVCYCPRVDSEVLILDSRCFSKNRTRVCFGCVFDASRIEVRLILIMCEILEERGN